MKFWFVFWILLKLASLVRGRWPPIDIGGTSGSSMLERNILPSGIKLKEMTGVMANECINAVGTEYKTEQVIRGCELPIF